MTLDTSNPQIPLDELINAAISGELALPDFQRDFVWKPKDTTLLISSVARRWPMGAFLIWDAVDSGFKPKQLEGLDPPGAKTLHLLLDGQQRLTSLLHAFHDKYSRWTFFAKDVPQLLLDPDVDLDDHISFRRKGAFYKEYPTLQDQAAAGIATIATLANNGEFANWANFALTRHAMLLKRSHSLDIGALTDARGQAFPGLVQFFVPCVHLSARHSLAAVARIFETTNRTGMRLGVVDLMLARLFPIGFHLGKQWEEVQNASDSRLQYFASSITAEDMLRLLAFWRFDGKRGMTKEPIFALEPTFVTENWDRAAKALNLALHLLRDRCGVEDDTALPSSMMVIPVAVALDRLEQRGDPKSFRHDVERDLAIWFWWCAATDHYKAGTNLSAKDDAVEFLARIEHGQDTKASADTKKWRANEKARADLKTELVERLSSNRRGESNLEATIMALIIKQGGRDWADKHDMLPKNAGNLERHHIFPTRGLPARKWTNLNAVANISPQSSRSNKELGNEMPGDLKLKKIEVEQHFVSFDSLAAAEEDQFDYFIEERSAALADELIREMDAVN